MRLVIPLKNDGNYEALRFALRSITTHHNITQCILVGGKPKWFTGEHIPHIDYGPIRKEENIRDKVIAGSKGLGEFMFANDDHILMQPLSSTWNKGMLSDNLAGRTGNGSYTRCLRNTFNHYGDVSNVDTHCPMMMNSELVGATSFPWPEFGIGFKTCYAQENGIASVFMPDCKVSAIPTGVPWFSLKDDFPVHTLAGLFPTPCRFEKEYVS